MGRLICALRLSTAFLPGTSTRSSFEPLHEVSLRHLSFKVLFLVAITSARCISELAALSIWGDLCVFLLKVNSTFHHSQELVLPNFCPGASHPLERTWHTLDVRRALKVYIWTASIRKTEALFVAFQLATIGSWVSGPALGWWLSAIIAMAYRHLGIPVPGRISAHSTRSAATSVAWSTQASLEEVCKAATWISMSPFICRYKVDTFASAEASFSQRVLQAVHHS